VEIPSISAPDNDDSSYARTAIFRYSINGRDLVSAFSDNTFQGGLAPAISFTPGNSVELRFALEDLAFLPSGFSAIKEEPHVIIHSEHKLQAESSPEPSLPKSGDFKVQDQDAHVPSHRVVLKVIGNIALEEETGSVSYDAGVSGVGHLVSNVSVSRGNWYYEVVPTTVASKTKIGWCVPTWSPNPTGNRGIGEHPTGLSFGFDPQTGSLHIEGKQLSTFSDLSWTLGDTIGSSVSLYTENDTMTIAVMFYINGKPVCSQPYVISVFLNSLTISSALEAAAQDRDISRDLVLGKEKLRLCPALSV